MAPVARPAFQPPELPLAFRQELLPHVLQALRGGWSCALVGLPGVGTSNVLRFAAETRVLGHYWGEAAQGALAVYVEADRLDGRETNGALASQMLASSREAGWPRADQAALRNLAEQGGQALPPLLDYACAVKGWPVILIIDEFDHALRYWPAASLRELRALRDQYKYRLTLLAGARREPGQLLAERAGPTAELNAVGKLVELFDEHTFPVQPYTPTDTALAVARKTVGWEAPPAPEQVEALYGATGGQAKLLMAALALLPGRLHLPWADIERGLNADPGVAAACQALWQALDAHEQAALWLLAQEQREAVSPAALEWLRLRGLAVGGPAFVFSRLFEHFVAGLAEPPRADSSRPPAASRLRNPGAVHYW